MGSVNVDYSKWPLVVFTPRGTLDHATIDALDAYGAAIGHAFQISDDILSETGCPVSMGKPVNNDRARGKLTYSKLLGLPQSYVHARQKIAEAMEAIAPLGERAAPLRLLADFVIERSN